MSIVGNEATSGNMGQLFFDDQWETSLDLFWRGL